MTYTGDERRRFPRVELLGKIAIKVLSHPTVAATVRGLSVSGFSIETVQPIEIGASHHFQFHFQDAPIQLDATCVHCTRLSRFGREVFVAGFDFDPLERRAHQALVAFIDEIALVSAD